MNAVRGRVQAGRIELEAPLPEGAEVVVLTGTGDELFELDAEQLDELEARMTEADRGETEPAALVLDRLR